MQYDSIEELMLELSLYPNRKMEIIKDCSRNCQYGLFAVAKDGNCVLFSHYGDLEDLSKVKTLDEYMVFRKIPKIIIPDSVTKIKEWAFYECKDLIDVTLPVGLKHIGRFAFKDCIYLTSIDIPGNVTSIGYYAFSGCYRLKTVTINSSCIDIHENIFNGCAAMKDLCFKKMTLEQVKSLKNYPWGIEDESIIKCEG